MPLPCLFTLKLLDFWSLGGTICPQGGNLVKEFAGFADPLVWVLELVWEVQCWYLVVQVQIP